MYFIHLNRPLTFVKKILINSPSYDITCVIVKHFKNFTSTVMRYDSSRFILVRFEINLSYKHTVYIVYSVKYILFSHIHVYRIFSRKLVY